MLSREHPKIIKIVFQIDHFNDLQHSDFQMLSKVVSICAHEVLSIGTDAVTQEASHLGGAAPDYCGGSFRWCRLLNSSFGS